MLINDNDDERRISKNIVNSVLKAVKTVPLEVAKYPVAMDEIVQDFESSTLQCGESEQHVQIVGIVGFGGAGKTTLAKELFNRKRSSINRSSFLFDVRDAATKNALHDKQKKLLEGLHVQYESFDNINEGKAILSDRLRSLNESVLIVLDDVDHPDLLDALLPPKDSLRPGSLIIVTTREGSILTMADITSVYRMRPLQFSHAQKLFCWHAFLRPSPLEGFEVLVEKFVKVCNGLPLSLKVIGAQLYSTNSKDYWESQLHKIQRILPKDIKDKLKVSYDALDQDEQEIFLDVACFFIGEKKSRAIAAWDGSGWSGPCGWETLFNKCLVELDEKDRIRMHNHLRDLGREIAMTHSPSRLFSPRQSTRIQHRNLQSWCSLKNLRVLELYRAEQLNELWEDETHLPLQLRELVIRENISLQRLPKSLGRLKHLEKIQLIDLKKLSSLPEEFCLLQSLEHLHLHGCDLKSLPTHFGDLVNLRHINLSDSWELRMLPFSFKQLKHLEYLNLSDCHELALESDILENITTLKVLSVSGCKELEELPRHIRNQASLKELNLLGTSSLRELPASIGQLNKLETLQIGSPLLTSLPTSLGNLSCLTNLLISGCKKLESLPVSMGRLNLLQHLRIQFSGVETFPKGFGPLTSLHNLRQIDLSNTAVSMISLPGDSYPSLESLNVYECEHLTEIETLPTALKFISLSCCKMLKNIRGIGGLPNLQTLKIFCCPELVALPSLESLVSLKEIQITGLPPKIEKVENLQHLKLLETQPSSTLTRKAPRPYDVFINHRGCDVKHTLARTIYHKLELVGFSAFLDQEEFELGDSIPTQLQEAIENASLHIAIFSENYAQSPWCLAELCFMLKTGTPIIPVFYHVKPDDLRWVVQGKGIYANAFFQHEKKGRYTSERLQEWMTALQDVSYISGYMLNNDNDDEGRILKSIVNSVQKEVQKVPLEVAKHPVAVGEAVTDTENNTLECIQSELADLRSAQHYQMRNNVATRQVYVCGCAESHQITDQSVLIICKSIQKFRKSIGQLQQLEKIVVDGSVNTSLKALPENFCNLQALKHLTLRWCRVLTSLPRHFGNLKSLEHLDLSFCNQLRELPYSFKQFKLLQHLVFEGCSNLVIPPYILGKNTKLEYLNFKDCEKLRVLPTQVPCQLFLKSLNLMGTSLEELPNEIGKLSSLEVLEIGSPYLPALPISMGNLIKLETLTVEGCTRLECLPKSLGLLDNLTINAPQVLKKTLE